MRLITATLVICAGIYAQSAVRVTGRVTADTAGGALNAQITAIHSAPAIRMQTALVDQTGAFALAVPTGRVTIIARADGFVSEQREILVQPGGASPTLQFNLAPAGSVSGRVLDPSGANVPRARVWLQYRGQKGAWQLAEEIGGEEADAFGYFTIPVVAQGRPFVLHAESEGWLLSTSGTIVLRGQELSGVMLLLSRRGATVSGQVSDRSGRVLTGASVHLRSIPAGTEFSAEQRESLPFARVTNRTAVVGADGRFVFSGVPTGRIIVTTEAAARRAMAEAEVTDGTETRLSLYVP